MTEQNAKTRAVIERHDQYMTINYGRYPIVIDRGEGCRLWDTEGKTYLDLFSGFGAGVLGHCHPDLVDAIITQAKKAWHVGNLFHSEPQTLLAEAIGKHGFGGRSFFCHSGADANEAAFKMARLYGRSKPGKSGHRYKIIATHQSFHGRTFGTMAATGQSKVREGFDPIMPGFSHVPYNDLKAIEQMADDQTVAIIVEPIQGEGGIHVPADDFLPRLRKFCDERDMLLICDEVWTGCGRTGRYFAHQHWNIVPDMMTLAKGVGGGLAVGVMCCHPRLADLFDHRKHGAVAHATTLGGNCVSMAVAARIFAVLERDRLVEKAGQLGDHAMQRLNAVKTKCPFIKQVRGKGLFIGVELDPAAPGAWFANATDVVTRCRENGVLINGTQNTILRLAPPLVVTREELDQGMNVIERIVLTGKA